MVEFIMGRLGQKLSILSLAIVSGVLQSLADATPARLGHTYLRRLYDVIHREGAPEGKEKYYSYSTLPPGILADLEWWKLILTTDMSRVVRPARSATLIPTFGDGSGTGTGGTYKLPGEALSLWMGQWSPRVSKYTSNWKELKTLLITLQTLAIRQPDLLKETTLFYFTDNVVTYYVSAAGSSTSKGLQALVEQVRNLELILDCALQVVHIPGLAMIAQGTDGLSRGVWVSDLHGKVDQDRLTASIFRPVPFQRPWVNRYCRLLGWGECTLSPWDAPLRGKGLMHRYTVHFPPPELARQAIVFFLEAWVETPLDTGALFFVPRVVPNFWQGLSKHVIELGTIPASETDPPPILPIPSIVLAVLPHFRCLTRPRNAGLDPHRGSPSGERSHKEQADAVRRLLPTGVVRSY